jgi:hypothetical protein
MNEALLYPSRHSLLHTVHFPLSSDLLLDARFHVAFPKRRFLTMVVDASHTVGKQTFPISQAHRPHALDILHHTTCSSTSHHYAAFSFL